MTLCYLGIGSNLGERSKNIKLAIQKINHLEDTQVIKASSIIETEAVGGPAGQGRFLNAVLKIRTALPVFSLLKKLKDIEKKLGRFRTVRFGPRTIDLDILLYGNKVIASKKLELPHPRMFERDFVIVPLLELL